MDGGAEAPATGTATAPTPATAPAPPAAGPMDVFLGRGVPTALKPGAPLSELKAPARLTTTTTSMDMPKQQQQQQQQGSLQVPSGELEGGTASPHWREVARRVEAAADSQTEVDLSFSAAFGPTALTLHAPALPAFVVTALVNGAAAAPRADVRAACLRALSCCAHALAALEARRAAAEEAGPSASALPWVGNRTAPLSASVAALASEPQLLDAMHKGMAEAAASTAALSSLALAATLAGSESGREAVAPSALAALAAAGQRLAERCSAGAELHAAVAALEAALETQHH